MVESDILYLFAIVAFLGGSLIVDGFRLRRQYAFMRDTATSTIQALALGPAEVNGTVKPQDNDSLFEAPVSGRDAVVCKYKIEAYDKDSDGRDRWREVASGVEGEQFTVLDDTGSLTVDPQGVTVDASDENTRQRRVYSSSEPASIEAFHDRNDDIDMTYGVLNTRTSGRRRYTEEIICPGDSVYLYGEATSPGSSSDVVVQESADEMFFISDQDEAELKDERRGQLLWRVPTGAVLISIGVVGACWYLGVLF